MHIYVRHTIRSAQTIQSTLGAREIFRGTHRRILEGAVPGVHRYEHTRRPSYSSHPVHTERFTAVAGSMGGQSDRHHLRREPRAQVALLPKVSEGATAGGCDGVMG